MSTVTRSAPAISARRLFRAGLTISTTMAVVLATQPVQAQAFTASNIVSACSGVSLPRSVVTDIIRPVIGGVVTPVQSNVNGILSALSGVPVVNALLPTPLAINAGQLLDNAAAGNNISVQAVSTNGTLLGTNAECYSTSDGITLRAPAGIAIGGNRITGLGLNGAAATSVDGNAIAFGNGAAAQTGATGAIALGTASTVGIDAAGGVAFGQNAKVAANAIGGAAFGQGAIASVAGGVALGAGSVADRAAQAGYTAFGLTTPQTSAGSVSIGAAGAARQLTNVAAGSAATDAVNVAQLQGVASQLGTLDGAVIKYDNTTLATATLGGAGGTRITNLRAGTIGAGSTDAVNGSQLNDTNVAVAAQSTRIDGAVAATTAVDGRVTNLRTAVANGTLGPVRFADAATPTVPNAGTITDDAVLAGASGGVVRLHNVGAGAVTATSTEAVNGSQLFATNGRVGVLETAANLGVQYDGSGRNRVTLGGTAAIAPVALGNVADGTLSATSTDAVNGRQLVAVRDQVTTMAGLAVQYDGSTKGRVTLGGVGALAPVAFGNVAAGTVTATSTDAVNGSQLFATDTRVGNLATAVDLAVVYDGSNKGRVTLGGVGALAPVAFGNVAAGTLSTTSTDAVNGSQLFATNGRVGVLESAANLGVQYDGSDRNRVTLGGVGALAPVAFGNIAAGTLSATSTDAVNGSQLFATNSRVGDLASAVDLAVVYDGSNKGRVTLGGVGATAPVAFGNVAAGVISASSTDAVNGSQLNDTNIAILAQGTRIDNAFAATTAVDARVTTLNNAVTLGTIGPVRFADAANPGVPNAGAITNDAILAGVGTAPVKLHNLGAGEVSASSTDAVNGSQLFDLEGRVGTLSGASALAVLYDGSSKGRVTLGGVGAASPVVLGNVAAGTLADASTDAVNGGQLFATNGRVGALETASTLAVVYDAADKGRVTLGGANAAGTVLLGNVRAGQLASGSTDAVNGGQLFDTNARITLNDGAITDLGTRVTTNTNNILINRNDILALRSDVGNGLLGPVRYSDVATPTVPNTGTPTNNVTLAGASIGPVGLHNVAAGSVTQGSTDAVNGDQLFAIQAELASASGADALAVRYADAGRTRIVLGGAGAAPVSLSNVKAADLSATSTDAVNGGQLFATNGRIEDLNTSIVQNNTAITNLGDAVDSGRVGVLRYSDFATPTVPNGGVPSQDVTLVGATGDAVRIHNLGLGAIGAGSLDAVNGSQLFTLANSMAGALGGATYNPVTNQFSASFQFGGNSFGSVQDVFGAIETSIASGGTGSGGSEDTTIKYFNTNSTMADSRATGVDSTAIGPVATASGEASVAAGRNAQATSYGAVAIGVDAMAKDGKAVSIGVGNMASGDGAVAIGDPNFATGEGAVAMGRDNNATGNGAIALGDTNVTTGGGSIAVGLRNTTAGDGAVTLGGSNVARGQSAIAIGAANSTVGALSLTVGTGNQVTGDGALAIGSNIVSGGDGTLAIGSDVRVTAQTASAVGNRAVAGGMGAAAFGADAVAATEESSAFGTGALANGFNGTAVGAAASASGTYATSIGRSSVASNFGTTSLGLISVASGYGSTALGAGAVAKHDYSVAIGASASTTRGAIGDYAAFGLDAVQTSGGEIAIARNVVYIDPQTGIATKTGLRQITGLSAGSEDNDAVNLAQLRGISAKIGGALATSLGGGASYDMANATIGAPTYTIGGTTYSNVGDAIAALDTRYTGGGGGGGGGSGPSYDNSDHSSVTLTGAGGTTITNVAAGAVTETSTDAVNGAQLHAVAQVAENSVQYDKAADGSATDRVTLAGSSPGKAVTVANVADGTVAAGSREAVNGGQLAATQATASQALALGQTSIQYDTASRASATLGSSGGPAVALRNVAAGTSATDAVNLSQMNTAVSSAITQANAYTDGKLAAISFDLKRVARNANAGTAGALAAAGMPQAYEAGRGMIAMGAGTYQGQTAVAVGFSKAFSDGRTVMKMGATYDSRGSVGASAGVGFQL